MSGTSARLPCEPAGPPDLGLGADEAIKAGPLALVGQVCHNSVGDVTDESDIGMACADAWWSAPTWGTTQSRPAHWGRTASQWQATRDLRPF